MRQVRATVSGSFSRHLSDVQVAVKTLQTLGVRVLSPERPTIVDALDGFVFVASDRHRSVRLVQDRHLASIMDSDFLWIECSDGYVGQSAALELGFAVASGVPVYGKDLPSDLTMRQYVTRVGCIQDAVSRVQRRVDKDDLDSVSILVDPLTASTRAHAGIERLGGLLTSARDAGSSERLHQAVDEARSQVLDALSLPGHTRAWNSRS